MEKNNQEPEEITIQSIACPDCSNCRHTIIGIAPNNMLWFQCCGCGIVICFPLDKDNVKLKPGRVYVAHANYVS